MQKNQEIILEITDITAEGSGVGRYEGMAVFVPLTAVGDTAKVKILKVKKTYAYGKLLEITTPFIKELLSSISLLYFRSLLWLLRHYILICRFDSANH